MSDFWDTYDQVTNDYDRISDRLDVWDETPSHTRDAMTSSDWTQIAHLYSESAERSDRIHARWREGL